MIVQMTSRRGANERKLKWIVAVLIGSFGSQTVANVGPSLARVQDGSRCALAAPVFNLSLPVTCLDGSENLQIAACADSGPREIEGRSLSSARL